MTDNSQNKFDMIVVGGGPAGLAVAITAKANNPQLSVCVFEKGAKLGSHNLSGAALESASLDNLLNIASPELLNSDRAKKVLARKVEKDQVLFMPNKHVSFDIKFTINLAKLFKVPISQMDHKGDYLVSISQLTAWLGDIAKEKGVEIYEGFAVEKVIWDESQQIAKGIKLKNQGIDEDGNKQWNYVEGEIVLADKIVLAEGCDGYVTEQFVTEANLRRDSKQLYSLGIKEVIEVSDSQYASFTEKRCVHAMGYPLWRPVLGPAMFGGGVLYPMGDNKIAVIMISALDWKHFDFNVQDALARFKQHSFVRKFIESGKVVESGAKMIPESGIRAIPRDADGCIGKSNVAILGDSAGFVNMIKIKGLHNAIDSGIAAGQVVSKVSSSTDFASEYTNRLDSMGVLKELSIARKFRQTVAKMGILFGLPISNLPFLLPDFDVEEDYKVMSKKSYPFKLDKPFDKTTFAAHSKTEHREDQPSHLTIVDPAICKEKCQPEFNAPCITFCPAGVYEEIDSVVKPANPSNCLHCKTCQRKCPFDNIRWSVPEGGGGPNYEIM